MERKKKKRRKKSPSKGEQRGPIAPLGSPGKNLGDMGSSKKKKKKGKTVSKRVKSH